MSRILQLKTGYKPAPDLSPELIEREQLKQIGLDALESGRFNETYLFINDLFKLVKFAAGQATLIDH